MKDTTKKQLIEIINKKGQARPHDLARLLKRTPQTIHWHLRSLLAQGILERRGKTPSTHYVMADTPDFKAAVHWFKSKKAAEPPTVSATRDHFAARLENLQQLRIARQRLPLLISASGEVGHNSFDHNIGQWRDVPGCWFEQQTTSNRHWVLIADRGQGIYRSLSAVVSDIPDDQSAVRKAFEEHLSGRAPEQRGNGLKFVKNIIMENLGSGVACRSGDGLICYGDFGKDCFNILKPIPDQDFGTITVMTWAAQ